MTAYWVVAAIVSGLYATLCEILAHNPNIAANSVLQVIKQLLGFVKTDLDNGSAGSGTGNGTS